MGFARGTLNDFKSGLARVVAKVLPKMQLSALVPLEKVRRNER